MSGWNRVGGSERPRRRTPQRRDERAEDVTQLTVAGAIFTALTALAWLRPATGRRALGLLFAATGLAWNAP